MINNVQIFLIILSFWSLNNTFAVYGKLFFYNFAVIQLLGNLVVFLIWKYRLLFKIRLITGYKSTAGITLRLEPCKVSLPAMQW